MHVNGDKWIQELGRRRGVVFLALIVAILQNK